ncbi:MAG: hypothetical protein Kow0074_20960 [Candidatus Zixiibacteriota bacterium]
MTASRVLIGLLAVLAGSVLPGSQSQSEAMASPLLVLHNPTFDFGYIPQRSHVSHRFWVHNGGDAPLTIERIDVGCWCTSTSDVNDPIPPGDSAAILVTLNTSIIQGHVRKWIKVFTSIAREEHERLWIRGYVLTDNEPTGVYRVTPSTLKWPLIRTDSAEGWVTAPLDRAHFDVANLTDVDVTLDASVCCSPCMDSVIAPPVLAANSKAQVIVYTKALADSATCAAPSVTLSMIARDTTRITVPIVIHWTE